VIWALAGLLLTFGFGFLVGAALMAVAAEDATQERDRARRLRVRPIKGWPYVTTRSDTGAPVLWGDDG